MSLNNVKNKIKITSDVIDNLIVKLQNDKGLMCQTILKFLRDLTEYIGGYLYCKNKKISKFNPDLEDDNKIGREFIKNNDGFLKDFHTKLNRSVSHYTPNPNEAIRLMNEYYQDIYQLKKYTKENCNIDVLNELNNFSIYSKSDLQNYYKPIQEAIEKSSKIENNDDSLNKNLFRVYNKKSFYYQGTKYFEIQALSSGTKFNSKSNLISFYTKQDIYSNYTIDIKYKIIEVKLYNINTFVNVITDYKVHITSSEFNRLNIILSMNNFNSSTNNQYYKNLMQYIKKIEKI